KHSIELLSQKAGEGKTDRRGQTYYVFPTPEAVAAMSEEELKACKLGYRWKYIHAAARDVVEGRLDLEALQGMEQQQALARLVELFGVGEKVASCVLLYGLHHMNAFPVDVWVKRILANEYPGGYPYEKYSPYNGIYQQYMFAYYRKYES
ncbi:MAG: DNA-3-methyladenine glycosylase 2 family protein, partial [Lachnospiraceae bacterium]|nr:DNA-3-methyladenine glycosylase 2 family protein [Lachnospiraceae bacterium]